MLSKAARIIQGAITFRHILVRNVEVRRPSHERDKCLALLQKLDKSVLESLQEFPPDVQAEFLRDMGTTVQQLENQEKV